jgi:hypothetical protein
MGRTIIVVTHAAEVADRAQRRITLFWPLIHGRQAQRCDPVHNCTGDGFLTLALSMIFAARRSAVPAASVTIPATASPCRFSHGGVAH